MNYVYSRGTVRPWRYSSVIGKRSRGASVEKRGPRAEVLLRLCWILESAGDPQCCLQLRTCSRDDSPRDENACACAVWRETANVTNVSSHVTAMLIIIAPAMRIIKISRAITLPQLVKRVPVSRDTLVMTPVVRLLYPTRTNPSFLECACCLCITLLFLTRL